jgi:sec-independent protein translocase protein TatC
VAIFILAAVMTPPDPISLLLMAFPLLGLYELSVWASIVLVRRRAKAAAAEA